MAERRRRRVAVLLGGVSRERDVSLVSGQCCVDALREAGHIAIPVDAGADVAEALTAAAPDCVLNMLHGRWGEDGCVQGILETLGIPYSHSGVMASALAMDKTRAKAVFRDAGLRVTAGKLAPPAAIAAGHQLEPPYVVKPNNEGSSIGVRIVEAGAEPPNLADCTADQMLVEKYVPGLELTVAIRGGAPLEVTEILPADSGWYDYRAKYAQGGSAHVLPARVPDSVRAEALQAAACAHDALSCRGISRADFRFDPDSGLLALLEINTQPGMTPTSLVPEQAQHCGMPFGELVAWMVEDASCPR